MCNMKCAHICDVTMQNLDYGYAGYHNGLHSYSSAFPPRQFTILNQFEIVPHLRLLNGLIWPICFLADVHKITSADCKKKSLTRSAFK